MTTPTSPNVLPAHQRNPVYIPGFATDPDPADAHVVYAKKLEDYRSNPTRENLRALLVFKEDNGFNYFVPVPEDTQLPEDRKPSPGLKCHDKYRYHVHPAFHRFQNMSKFGYNALGYIWILVTTLFVSFLPVLLDYCRPSGSIDAIFENFNQPTSPVAHIDPIRLDHIMCLIMFFFAVRPYSPIAFPDLRFYKWSLVTASDYHTHHSFDMKREAARYWKYLKDTFRLHSRFDYSERPRSKGYFFNPVLVSGRWIIHNIKYHGLPFAIDALSDPTDIESKLLFWFMKYPTALYVRSQISKLLKLKVRPVYNAPFLFILIEAMLTLPLMAMCRLPENCLLWGFETIRGGMQELNREASHYETFIMIDWSRFDQLAPFAIIYHFWCTFLPMLLRIDRGWMPTKTADPATSYSSDDHKLNFTTKYDNNASTNFKFADFIKRASPSRPKHVIMFAFIILNLLSFIWLWYVKMVFITPDGFAYTRLLAGVPSGIFMTQILDSFVNAFLLIDALLEFGFTSEEIKLIRMFIQGDDNIIFTNLQFQRIFDFYDWLPSYAETRWHMIISVEKSSITRLRERIEVLGYRNNNGMPARDFSKIVASLAFPERHPRDENRFIVFMARAIGLAYANAGHDPMVHDLCFRSYSQARTDSGLTHDELKNIEIPYQKLGFFEIFSVDISELKDSLISDLSSFPDFYEIRQLVSIWQGPHTVHPLWPRQFADDLASTQESSTLVTLYDIMQEMNYRIPYHF